MANKKLKVGNVPNLRFPGFEGEWEEKKLGEIGEISSGGTPNRNNVNFWNGNIPWVSTSLIDFNTIYQVLETITEEGLKKSSAKLFPKNSVLMAMYGQGKTRGKVAILGIEASTNQACACIIPKKSLLNSNFLFQNLSKRYDEIREMSNTGGQENLSGAILKSIKIKTPSLKEQHKISTFLELIDKRIQTQSKIIEELKLLKKTLSKKIFSRQFKLKDENGNDFPEWGIKKVGDIFTITRGDVLSMNLVYSDYSEETPYPVYSSQTKNKGLAGYYNDYLFENAITWTTDGANAGDVNYRSGKFYCTNVCGVLINKDGYANTCIAELINSVSKNFVSYVGNPKLMNGVMSKIAIPFPSIKEQKRISKLFSAIDTKIDIEAQLLQRLEVQKKHFLANLFI